MSNKTMIYYDAVENELYAFNHDERMGFFMRLENWKVSYVFYIGDL